MTTKLPEFIPPMLASTGGPFDSERHLFEIKWDGIRALAFVEAGGFRLMTRTRRDVTANYPDLDVLAGLPEGCVLDGEIVVMREGRSDFHEVMTREQARGHGRIESLARSKPATYVAFDALYGGFEPVITRPLTERRELLAGLVGDAAGPRLVTSDGVVGAGHRFFEEACRLGLEGIVAKRLDSRYVPGRRTDDWVKIKRRSEVHCAVIGYIPKGDDDLKSLVLATDLGDGLRFVGRVGSGLLDVQRERLLAELRARERPSPLVPCPERAVWVEPGIYCLVRYLELTREGHLRGPSLRGLSYEDDGL